MRAGDPPLAVVGGACSADLIESLTAGDGAADPIAGFAQPQLLEGLEPICTGTQALEGNDYTSDYAYAVLPLSDSAMTAIDERVLATGLERGDPVLTYYIDAQQAVMATLYPMLLWQELEERGPYDDAEAWLVLRWYVPR